MIKSMTGYGSFRALYSDREINVEIKSVNHKFFECGVHTARAYAFLEDRVRKYCGEIIDRGKVDVNIGIAAKESDDIEITANTAVLDGYLDTLYDYAYNSRYNIDTNIGYDLLLRIPDGFSVTKKKTDEESLWADVRDALDEAVQSFTKMRIMEGDKLRDDIAKRLSSISDSVDIVEMLSPESVKRYRERLFEKLNELLEGRMDESRILTESAIFAEKVAVAEETVRLKSHISQFYDFLDVNGPIGRKMDFLTQEMNREANTIGSKAQDIQITKLVLEIKSDIENIREQVQNIE
jgi:uncharacterized protein (TIGR00255 family)